MANRLGTLLLVLSAWSLAPRTAHAADPRAAAGAPARDPFPNGCVDCHLDYADRKMDVRLSTLLARWSEKVDERLLARARAAAPPGAKLTGKHPKAASSLSSIPGGCLKCHGKSSTRTPPFSTLIHAVHFDGGGENHFVKDFGGQCTHCHKLDAKTGALKVPSAPER